MAVHFILDGYNVIKRTAAWADCPLPEGRTRLLQWIAARRPQGSARNRVTVVFDGREDVTGPASVTPVKVIFTSGESADEKIKGIVGRADDKKSLIVVTDDREIRFHVRALGAGIRSVDDFLGTAGPSAAKTAGRPSARRLRTEKRLSKFWEAKITDELRDVWLKGR